MYQNEFVIIFYFLYGNLLVSGIPLNQLIQAQTYNKNGYDDLNVLLQQAFPQLYQQPSNNKLYPQQYGVQNEILYQTPTNQQINPITNQLNQLYMDRILSSPTVQGILDSNARYYNPVIVETPNQMPNSIQNTGRIPQVVNNYFILSPELMNIEEELNHHNSDKKNADRRKQTDQHHRRKPSKEAINNSGNENVKKQPTNQNNNQNQRRGNNRTQDNNNNNKQKSHVEKDSKKRPNRRPNGRPANATSEKNNNRQMKGRKSEERPIKDINKTNPRKDNINDNTQKDLPLRNDKQHESNMKEEIKQTNNEKSPPKQSNNKESIDATKTNDHPRKKINRKEQENNAFIEDLRKKFPGMSEEAINDFLSYMNGQQFDGEFDYSQFYSPDIASHLRFNTFNHTVSPKIRQAPKNHQKPRTDRKPASRPNQRPRPKPVVVANNTTPAPSPTDSPTTKPKLTASVKPQETKTESTIQATISPSIAPELGSESKVPEVNNHVIDDYYPDFTNDNTYFNSEEIYSVRNHRDNRYYYTTDRNEGHNIKEDDTIENVIMKPMNEEKTEVIEFRTPPMLESPDFRTKPIKKAKPKSNEQKGQFYDKSSNYSEAKPTKDVKSNKGDKNKKSEAGIETVFAHSKVVNYGKNYDKEDEVDIPVVTYYLPDNMEYEEDGKVIIIAKSIPADHFW